MIKFLRKLQSFIRDDRGLIGGGGIIERIIVYGAGILGLALLVFPVRLVLPDSQIASQSVSTIQIQGTACIIGRTEATVLISAQKAALEALGEKINGE